MPVLTRRTFLRTTAALTPAVAPSLRALTYPAPNTYQNPILGGDHPDASPIRVGQDFFLTHSSFDYAPGLLIYHSVDLVNWRPVASAVPQYHGSIWAPYLCEHAGHFYLYYPSNNRLTVVHAPHPTGPWSAPVDLGISAIDPAHIAEGGRRFLYMNGGQMAELAPDGLSVLSPPRPAFEPWPVPATTRMECTCIEGPKLLEHNGWFYLTFAEGGTGGPATSHSVISARSRHAVGPWEFSPWNPIVHTPSRRDRWLSVGHGRLIDTPDGRWYMTVHSYENGYRTLGRQLLLLPVEWTSDGWFRLSPEVAPDSLIPMPVPGAHQQPFEDPSDEFTSSPLALHWGFWRDYDPARFSTGNGFLRLQAKGTSFETTSPLTTPVGGHSYTVEVEIEADPTCEAGLLLFYNSDHATAITLGPQGVRVRLANGFTATQPNPAVAHATLRIVNDDQEVDFFFKLPGQPWRRTEESAEVSGLHHNVLGGFLDLRPALAAWHTGAATFRHFRYWPQARPPRDDS